MLLFWGFIGRLLHEHTRDALERFDLANVNKVENFQCPNLPSVIVIYYHKDHIRLLLRTFAY